MKVWKTSITTLALVSVTIFCNFAYSKSTELTGQLICKVTDLVILQTIDGKPSEFNGIKDYIGKGDELELNYRLSIGSLEQYTGGMNLRFRLAKSQMGLAFFGAKELKSKSDDIYFVKDMGDLYETLRIGRNSVVYQWGATTLVLYRYYKDDWHGIYSSTTGADLSSEIRTLDCRTRQSTIGEVVDKIKTLDILDLLGIEPSK